MIASMNANFEVVKTLTKEGANKGIEDVEGKTAREHAIESLEQETRKPSQDLKIKKKIGDLNKILAHLPDSKKDAELDDSNDASRQLPQA